MAVNDLPDLYVPVRKYFRPDGQSKGGFLIISSAATPERKRRVHEITEVIGIEFTLEEFPTEVNICMDTGDFDYQFELVAPEQVNATVLRLIDEFDVANYRAAAAIHEAEETVPPWANES